MPLVSRAGRRRRGDESAHGHRSHRRRQAPPLAAGPVLDLGAGVDEATPYTLRHSFASLLLHEGRSVIYVARQLGHDARLTLTRYGHVIDKLKDQPQIPAEQAIREARSQLVPSPFPEAVEAAGEETTTETKKPRRRGASSEVELGGLEPPTSWVRSRRSPN
jgi:hypothetical protein